MSEIFKRIYLQIAQFLKKKGEQHNFFRTSRVDDQLEVAFAFQCRED